MKQIAQVGNKVGCGHIQADYPAVGNTRKEEEPDDGWRKNHLGANVADGADSVPTKTRTCT